MRWNEHKDHSGGSAEVKFMGEVAAFYAASAIWEETHFMDAGNNIDQTRVLHHMLGLDDGDNIEFQRLNKNLTREEIINLSAGATPHLRRAGTRSRDGSGSNVRFFATTNAGPDTPTTFNFSDVILFTDALVYYHPSKASGAPDCDTETELAIRCLTGGCYLPHQRCDRVAQCPDGSDEAGCKYTCNLGFA